MTLSKCKYIQNKGVIKKSDLNDWIENIQVK